MASRCSSGSLSYSSFVLTTTTAAPYSNCGFSIGCTTKLSNFRITTFTAGSWKWYKIRLLYFCSLWSKFLKSNEGVHEVPSSPCLQLCFRTWSHQFEDLKFLMRLLLSISFQGCQNRQLSLYSYSLFNLTESEQSGDASISNEAEAEFVANLAKTVRVKSSQFTKVN